MENNPQHKRHVMNKIYGLINVMGSQKAVAKHLGVSEMYLCDVLKYRREPGEKILKPLGYEKVIRYRKIKESKDVEKNN